MRARDGEGRTRQAKGKVEEERELGRRESSERQHEASGRVTVASRVRPGRLRPGLEGKMEMEMSRLAVRSRAAG